MIMPSHEAQVIFTLSDILMENTKSKEKSTAETSDGNTHSHLRT